jgi:hypothetical protein
MTREKAAYQLENYLRNTPSDSLLHDVIKPLVNTIYPIGTYYKAAAHPTLCQWYLRRGEHITISDKSTWKEHSPDFNVIYTQDSNHMFIKYKHLQPSWWQLPKPVDLIQNILKNYNVDGFDLHEIDGYIQLKFTGGILTIRPEGSTYVVNGANGVNADLVDAVKYALNTVPSKWNESVPTKPAFPLTAKEAFDKLMRLNEECIANNLSYISCEKRFSELINIVYPRRGEPIVTFSQPQGNMRYYSIAKSGLTFYTDGIKIVGIKGYLFQKNHPSSLNDWSTRIEVPEAVEHFLAKFPKHVLEHSINSTHLYRYYIRFNDTFKGWIELDPTGKYITRADVNNGLSILNWVDNYNSSLNQPAEPIEPQLQRTLPLGSNIVSRGLDAVVQDKKGTIVNLPLDSVMQEKLTPGNGILSSAEEELKFVPISINIPKLPSFNDEE